MRKLKVLIGGEEALFGGIKKAALESWGCDVVLVPDGKQACAVMRAAHVDLCLLDWELPKMTGLAVCHWIRSVDLKTQPHIVLLTGQKNPEQIQAAYLAGANNFISKPLNLEDLHFLVAAFSQKVAQQELTSSRLSHIDPLEIYRRDLAGSRTPSRL